MCSELCVKLQASNDIDLLIVYTHNSCGSETCLHGPKGKLERPDQSPTLHLSGEEIHDSNLKVCKHTMCATPALQRKEIVYR